MNKRRGYTLLELVIVIGIITVISSGAVLASNKINEKKDYGILTKKLENYMYTMALESDSKDEVYNFTFDFNSKLIFFVKNGKIISKFKLPKSFEYEDKNGNKIIIRGTTTTGNITRGFSLYTFDKNNKAIFKETFINNKKYIKFICINKYKPKFIFFKGEHLDNGKWIKIE